MTIVVPKKEKVALSRSTCREGESNPVYVWDLAQFMASVTCVDWDIVLIESIKIASPSKFLLNVTLHVAGKEMCRRKAHKPILFDFDKLSIDHSQLRKESTICFEFQSHVTWYGVEPKEEWILGGWGSDDEEDEEARLTYINEDCFHDTYLETYNVIAKNTEPIDEHATMPQLQIVTRYYRHERVSVPALLRTNDEDDDDNEDDEEEEE